MELLDQLTPRLYALVKRDRRLRNAAMPIWKLMAKAIVRGRSLINREPVLPPPRCTTPSTEAWISAAKARNPSSRHSFIPLQPAVQITRTLPKTVEATVHWKYRANEVATQPPTFVA